MGSNSGSKSASNKSMALTAGAVVPVIASSALDFARRSNGGPLKTQKRHMSSHAHFITDPSQMRDYAKRIYDDVKEFVQEEVIPLEHVLADHEDDPNTRWTVIPEVRLYKRDLEVQKCQIAYKQSSN